MKMNWLAWTLPVLIAVTIQLPAQQSVSSSGTNASSEIIPDWAKDDTKTFKGTKAKAENGDAVAQYNLGVCYRDG